jgi:hypothetical protein
MVIEIKIALKEDSFTLGIKIDKEIWIIYKKT